MYIAMDMGTSNTRLWLCRGDKVISAKKGAFGAGSTKSHSREYLFNSLRSLIDELLSESSVSASELKCIMVSGMAGSEIGLCDISHIPLPADIYTLADNVTSKAFPEITEIPFVFVPGLKKMDGENLADIMRGEETEVAGILNLMNLQEDCLLVLPGTHNKIISVSKSGEITDFHTTFSGELINGIINNSVLTGDVSHEFEINQAAIFAGSEYAKKYGTNAALFHIRVMMKNGKDTDYLSSFLYGAVIGKDTLLIHRLAGSKRIYIGGRKNLRRAHAFLLGEENVTEFHEDIANSAVLSGLIQIYKLISARDERARILSSIEKEKLIAIIRAPEKQSFIPAMQALYDGGVRLAEITYDRTRKQSAEFTANLIKSAVETFGEDMFIGAGTVTTPGEVMLTYNAGGKFIISPNCDAEIIKLTKKLGLVSIPAAFTPTEIADAIKAGADFVKLFPADQVSAGYVKAVSAPLSDAKLLAVGGVDVSNAGEMIKRGFCGVGIGSNLYDKKLIQEGKFTELSELAKAYAEAVK